MPADIKPKASARVKKSTGKPGAGDSLSKDAQAVYDQCLAAVVPVSTETVQSFLPEGKNDVTAASSTINQLLSRRLLEALQHNGDLVYKAVSQNEARRMGGMDGDESMVYQYIKSSGNEGIWSRHIKGRTNLHATVITRTLKSLESKSLIKCVRSVQNPTRKIYMLYDLIPSIEVSGGPWFTDSELDVEFVGKLSNAIERFINSKSRPKNKEFERLFPPSHTGFPTAQGIHEWLRGTGLTDVDLGIADIYALLDVLIYDGKVEKRRDGITYKSVSPLIDDVRPNAFTDMPCGHCPVFNLCQEGGVVSPEGCVYWGDWLSRNL
ncbi:DNA-directed RNA polymerase III subunit RPC6 [Taphrina deformans PYCC 5710]|uniref:DNA-directed RNA polymerase III subunit RPC6 n=1 Tax=Taphrina deformans (strain PYCC 5710 / ATCC 11124 / CBS 356.35 / IMI 108563 / JCM 9778 / NBRC 8474) TaxID=1097556 RepID=R4XD53_TAPDE|nr:DNA-directed RNA polymerase III subunit RPC6 [Taphrina deformans PYCC 5710]|eukprot:CCG81250.1 DNA-directed RNA polymerase III subunit RPC6 [Taphrina deformans PYCC 5710]